MAMIKQYQKKNGEKAWYFKTYLGTDPLTEKRSIQLREDFALKKRLKLH